MWRITSFFKTVIFTLSLLAFQVSAEPVIAANSEFNYSNKAISLEGVFIASETSDEDGDTIIVGIMEFSGKGRKDIEFLFGKRHSRLFKKKFSQMEFEGRGLFPTEFQSYETLGEWLAMTANSIGIIEYDIAVKHGLQVFKDIEK